jgi:uncharacterized protein (TIGR00290 family)
VARNTWLCWSSGKDSAWALAALRDDPEHEVTAILTTVNRTHDRVAMHAVRRELLVRQGEATGLPVVEVPIPSPCSNAEYEAAMAGAVDRATEAGVTHMAFGDLFLEDVRTYRETMLGPTRLEPIFPIWGLDTHELAREMVAAGLEAWVTCVDPRVLGSEFAGRRFDGNFLEDLPESVDPCGERGEFHTFACAGPMFRMPISVRPGEIVERDGFVFADLLPE